jgi:hypothetical protein
VKILYLLGQGLPIVCTIAHLGPHTIWFQTVLALHKDEFDDSEYKLIIPIFWANQKKYIFVWCEKASEFICEEYCKLYDQWLVFSVLPHCEIYLTKLFYEVKT